MTDPSPSQTRHSLLDRLRQSPDDPSAWTEFVARYGPQILSWCQRWRLQDADAQDVTQAAIAPPLAVMRPPEGTGAIAAPLLWVVGDRDPYCPPEAVERLPGEHRVLRGANHFFWAKEDHLIRTVVDFLDRAGA